MRALANKLYLSLFWLSVVLCGSGALVAGIVNGHDYIVVRDDFACWDAAGRTSMAMKGCNIESSSYGYEPQSSRGWNSGHIEMQAERQWHAKAAPLWLLPVVVLALLRRWVRWLLMPEPASVPPRQ